MDHLVVVFSEGFSSLETFNRVLDAVVGERAPSAITAVNDVDKLTSSKFETSKVKTVLKDVSTKAQAKQLVDTATHLVIFWSGNDHQFIVWEAFEQRKPTRISTFRYTKAVNVDRGDKFDVYIGRRGMWGNPFPIVPGTDETRERVVERYKEYFENEILNDPVRHKALLSLRGFRLGCHCKPDACHGDVIANYLNNYVDPEV